MGTQLARDRAGLVVQPMLTTSFIITTTPWGQLYYLHVYGEDILLYNNELVQGHKLVKEGQHLNNCVSDSKAEISGSFMRISEFIQESVLRRVLTWSLFKVPLWLPPELGNQVLEVCTCPGHTSVKSCCYPDYHNLDCVIQWHLSPLILDHFWFPEISRAQFGLQVTIKRMYWFVEQKSTERWPLGGVCHCPGSLSLWFSQLCLLSCVSFCLWIDLPFMVAK